ncbi:MAG: hypothetical protein AAB837_00100 [Patescibacteria group bacterium]
MNDLNIAKSIGTVWQIIKSKEVNAKAKLELLLDFDKVLGLKSSEAENLPDKQVEKDKDEIPVEVMELKKERDEARRRKDWQKSNELGEEIEKEGYFLEDEYNRTIIKKRV